MEKRRRSWLNPILQWTKLIIFLWSSVGVSLVLSLFVSSVIGYIDKQKLNTEFYFKMKDIKKIVLALLNI